MIHPDDRDKTAAEIQKLAAGGNTFDFQCRYICKKSLVKWLSWNATPVEEEGLLYATARDVTEGIRAEQVLKESEKRFSCFSRFRTSADLDVRSRQVPARIFNKNWLDFTGRDYGRGTGAWLDRRCASGRLWAMSGNIHAVFRCPWTIQDGNIVLRSGNGEYRWLLDIGVPRFAEDGEFSGYIGSCIDITERKQAENAQAYLASIVTSHWWCNYQ